MTPFSNRFVPLTEFIRRNAQWYPDKVAVCFGLKSISWQTLNQRINCFANRLIDAGISKGDTVAFMSRNRLEYPEILFGILKAGGVAVPVSTLLDKKSVFQQLIDARPKAVITEHPFAGMLDGLISEHPDLPSKKRILISGSKTGWVEYSDFCSCSPASEPRNDINGEDLYNIIYSSGTTGKPKGIVHTHRARLFFALTCGLEFRVHNETVACITTPLYSNGTQLMFLPTILTGGKIVIMPSFDPAELLRLVRKEKCTHIFMVPTQFIRTMQSPEFEGAETSSVEILLSAAAPLRKETKNRILDAFPNSRLVELYGLTEGISTVLRPDEQFSKTGSVGKPRLGGDIKIIDEDGNELPRGKTGEIVGINFSMMKEYYKDREATNGATWQDGEGNTYLKTGDIGKLDTDGYLYILDRKKDLIISGGFNIYPSDIENVILQHPEVAEAAVVGIHHDEWGETPLALVVKKNTESILSREALIEWTNGRLAGYQKITHLQFIPSLPKNDLGKILKRELRESLQDLKT